MSPPVLTWFGLRWPRRVEAVQLEAIGRLLASTAGTPLIVEAEASAHRVEHRLALPAARADAVREHLRMVLPGLGLSELAARPTIEVTRAVELRLSTQLRPLRIEGIEIVSRALLTALQAAGWRERLVLQWTLVSPLRPMPVSNHAEKVAAERWSAGLVTGLLDGREPLDSETRNALRAKRSLPAWRAVGRIAVTAASEPRQRQLLRQLLDALRTAEAPGVHLRIRRCSPTKVERVSRPWFPPLRLNAAELVAVSAWPIGSTAGLPIERLGSRPLPPSAAIPRRGHLIGQATFPGSERPLALPDQAMCMHLQVLGPTGAGKSTVLANLALASIAAGDAAVVIEPKGDLVADILDRIPKQRIEDVVVIDPSDTVAPVGLNPLRSPGRSPEALADGLLAMFRALYSSWGPRTNEVLACALTTLAQVPGMSLAALPVLLTDPSFRRRVVGQLNDPVLGSFWTLFESWSDAERTAAVGPTMNRVRPFLMRPQLRAIVGQTEPRFDINRHVFEERKVLLVNLARGSMGPEVSSLLGALVINRVWEAAQGRAALPPERRRPVFVVCDEFQTFLGLPIDLADALAQARGWGVSFALAHQSLAQLPSTAVAGAVAANCRSKICFQLAADDARVMAKSSRVLEADDFQELGAYEIYAQLVANGAVQPWCSARTLPLPPALGTAERVRELSRERYGVSRAVVDAEIEKLFGHRPKSANDLAPRLRSRGER